ncbi:unnamed protein product, partial [Medioppia subpectinata]
DIQIFIFHIENADQWRRGAKARVKEMGPYVFTMSVWKDIISWENNGESVKYWSSMGWEFDPEKSDPTYNTKMNVLNIPVYAMVAVVRHYVRKVPLSRFIEPFILGSMNLLIASHGLGGVVLKRTPRELLEGYHFRLMDTVELLSKPLLWLGIQLPDTRMPGNKFGLLNVKNGTPDGPYEVYTGVGGTKFAKFIAYKGNKSFKTLLGFDAYDNPKCNMFNGTDGATLGQFLNEDTKVYIYNGELCRSIYVAYKEPSRVVGIPTMRFVLPEAMFAGPQKNPDNKCFCFTPNDPDMCDGVYHLGTCYFGAPLALTFPHFLYASDKIKNSVDGLNPTVEDHDPYFDIFPSLGVPLRGRVGLQVAVFMEATRYVIGFGGFPDTVLPVLWFKVDMGVEGLLALAAGAGLWPLQLLDWGSVVGVFAGMGVMGYTSMYAFNKRKILRKPKQDSGTDIMKIEGQTNGPPAQELPLKSVVPTYAQTDYPANRYRMDSRGAISRRSDNPPIYTISQEEY